MHVEDLVSEDVSWSHFLWFQKTFLKFLHKSFVILCDIIGLEWFLLSFSQS